MEISTQVTDAMFAPDGPLAKATIGGHEIDYFKEPGVGSSPPPSDHPNYRDPKTGAINWPKYGQDVLKWTADKAVAHGMIASSFVREFLVVRAESAELAKQLAEAHQDVANLRLDLARLSGDVAEHHSNRTP